MKFMGKRIKLRSFNAPATERGCLWCGKKLTKAQKDDSDFCRPSCGYQFGERCATIGARLTDDGWKFL